MVEPRTEKELLDLANKHSFRGRLDKRAFAGPIFVRGFGSLVWDVNGKEYLDFNSGQMCSALGHNHPRIVQALRDSTETLIHSHASLFNDREILLASRLADISPPGMNKSLFLGSGSDANEAAIAIAKKFTGAYEVASPMVSFHGQSEGVRSLTFAGWHKGGGPYAPGNYAILAPYRYRCSFCQEKPNCDYTCLDSSFDLLDAQAEGQMAAIITEPLFSAGGVIEAPPGWLRALKGKCEERGMLMILDEAQTGLAKLGTMWAFQQEDVVPDMFTVSKHFGGGIAISAVVTTDDIEERVSQRGFSRGHSHTNDPLPCNAAIASLDIILDQGLADVAKSVGDYWRGHLQSLSERYEIIGDIRGRGLLQGVELVKDRVTKEPAYQEGQEIGSRCLQNGLILSVRRGGSVLRFVPPFTTTRDLMDRAAQILEDAIRGVISSTRQES